MATTNISTEIVSITGVSAHAASDDFIVSAQKFVVASVPKNLLKWAATLTTASSHGGNTSQGVNIVMPTATDSILDVSRNGFSATEVPYSMKGFIANTSSLQLATNTYPKYYLDNAVTDKGTIVIVKPVPTDSATARVLYVDYTKIDDDSDLRNAVIYYSSSKEFEKLASAQDSDITTALTAINTELNETQAVCDKIDADLVLAKAEVVLAKTEAAELATQTDNSSTFNTALAAIATELNKVDNIIDLANDEFDEVAVEVSATATSPISLARTAVPSIISVSDLSVLAVPPDVPSLATVSFSESNALSISATTPTAISLTSVSYTSVDSDIDATAPDMSTTSVAVASTYTGSAPNYTKVGASTTALAGVTAFAGYWTLADFGDSDPGSLVVSPTAPSVPSISAASVTITGTAPSYVGPSYGQVDTYIDTDDDVELAQAKLQELSVQVQDSLNRFNKENTEYQAKLQKDVQDAQLESTEEGQKLQKYSAEVQQYQADVSKEVQEYQQKLSRYQLELGTVYQAWAKTESDRIAAIQADIQDELNDVNIVNVSYQSAIQESMQEVQIANQANLQDAQADLQVAIDNEQRSQERQLQTAVNDMQAIVADNQRKIAQYQAEASHYATEVNQYIQNYTSRLQKDVQDTQATIANNGDLLQKYQSELGQYQAEVAAEVQEYQQNLDQKLKEFDSSIKLQQSYYQEAESRVNAGNAYLQEAQGRIAQAQGYTTEVGARAGFSSAKTQAVQGHINTAQSYVATAQGFGNEVQAKIVIAQGYATEITSRLSNKSSHSQSADRYYKMAHQEVVVYIQNNSKMIAATMTSRSQAAQA
jgi:hypothetical protein